MAVVLECELICDPVLRRERRGHRLRQIRAGTWQRVRQQRSAVAVARNMPRRIDRVIPDNGVYITATLIDGQWRRSVTNIGTRPTFGANNESSVETFVLDWSGDLYGDVVRVRFLHRLRAEKKFNSIDELKSRIEQDVARARSYFKHAGVRNSLSVS